MFVTDRSAFFDSVTPSRVTDILTLMTLPGHKSFKILTH